jgi:hypothetical protein
MAKKPAFRIAMRTTDDGWWIALLARIEHMDDTLELGRIRRGAAEDPQVRAKFIETMQIIIEGVLAEKLDLKVAEWQIQKPMPPSEGRG